MENISWKLIDKYFKDNTHNLVAHHLESYNDFFDNGINRVFNENNPIRFIEREEKGETRNECLLYLGGKDGSKIYFGKPVIYDDNYAHYMYPNDARLRNMTYGITIHYDVDVDFIYYGEDDEKKTSTITLEKIYLGRFPIMLQSKLCILNSLSKDVRFNMGECKYDYGGYFIIDGKEKLIICQEKFANNMLYIKKNKQDDLYSHSAEIRSVSEDASKPMRTSSVKIIAPTSVYSNNQIVVLIPNVRKPIPLFILMRALGVTSDKSIIEYCLLDIENNESYVDLFIPSIHDANKIFNQEIALEFIASFTKRHTITGTLDILMNYFLPHIGTENFLDKAYFVGYMVNRMLRVYTKENKPTDRDNFRFKRIELSGALIYDLFREYLIVQYKDIFLKIDKKYYYGNKKNYKQNFMGLIENNYKDFFKDRIVETGFKRAFKGNWGSQANTKRIGVVQDISRLSWNSFISQLRKLNLPFDASAKIVGPRLLNSSQWGYIDPVDTPDGGNIGLHKHISLSTAITSGMSGEPIIKWLRSETTMKLLQECSSKMLGSFTKVFVNSKWVGSLDNPIETIETFKMFRRNGLISAFISIYFEYSTNEISIFTDSGRLIRPIYYIDKKRNKVSFDRKDIIEKINSGDFSWSQVVTGFLKKIDGYNFKNNKIYEINELYPQLTSLNKIEKEFEENMSVIEYVDTSEEEGSLIATSLDSLKTNKFYTHIELESSLIFGVMGNMIIYPENNPLPRNSFSCGQSKQAVSIYHSNFQSRFDKMGVILNYGQVPLLKSKYLEYINNEEMPYGVNTIVAIMSYTGYNVEDAILVNQGSINRGLFRTSYYSTYESREESTKSGDSVTKSFFADVLKKNVSRIKPGSDYSHLDKWGLVKENTLLDDKTVVIGKVTSNSATSSEVVDSSIFPKKGQLGYVDKVFITDGEEGTRIAKVRVREERIPAIGDKMASRAGQKGTIGLIIPECDMPFTSDGIKPDLIINPHALPSRMTIGQLIESLFGKACLNYGGYGDCTAFQNKGQHTKVYGEMLVNAGFHSSGNQVLYNGYTGEQIYSDIYIGPTYYMRLKHMVKDKINYRARGPRTLLVRQTVQGRANDGGLKIGEMERDGILAHGASAFLNESYMIRGDEYFMAVCNKTGGIAVYNSSLNLFLSPFADGPLKYSNAIDGKINIQKISRFGRSFSIVRVPYALKLLIQELQAMNVQMRIITDDNIDQLVNMSYSNNMNKLLKDDTNNLSELTNKHTSNIIQKIQTNRAKMNDRLTIPVPEFADSSIPYASGEEAYVPTEAELAKFGSPGSSPGYNPEGDDEGKIYNEWEGQEEHKSFMPDSQQKTATEWAADAKEQDMESKDLPGFRIKNPEVKNQFDKLPERDKIVLMKMIAEEKAKKDAERNAERNEEKDTKGTNQSLQSKALEPVAEENPTSILKIDKEPEKVEEKDSGSGSGSGEGSTKTVSFK